MTAGQVWAKREYIMKINGVTVFQETLTMNSSLCIDISVRKHTHTACMCNSTAAWVVCKKKKKTQLKSLVVRRSSSATRAQWSGHTEEVASKMMLKKTNLMFGVAHKEKDDDDFMPVYSNLQTLFCWSFPCAVNPTHATALIKFESTFIRRVAAKQWIKQFICNSSCQSDCDECL